MGASLLLKSLAEFAAAAANKVKSFLGQLCRPKNTSRGESVPRPPRAGAARGAERI